MSRKAHLDSLSAAPAILKDSLDLSEAGYHHPTFPCHSLLKNETRVTPVCMLPIIVTRAIGQYVALVRCGCAAHEQLVREQIEEVLKRRKTEWKGT